MRNSLHSPLQHRPDLEPRNFFMNARCTICILNRSTLSISESIIQQYLNRGLQYDLPSNRCKLKCGVNSRWGYHSYLRLEPGKPLARKS